MYIEQTQIYPQMWMEQTTEIRNKLVNDFEIHKSTGTQVVDNKIITDGVTAEDLLCITAEKMAEYVGSPKTTSFLKLWNLCVSKAMTELNPPINLSKEINENSNSKSIIKSSGSKQLQNYEE